MAYQRNWVEKIDKLEKKKHLSFIVSEISTSYGQTEGHGQLDSASHPDQKNIYLQDLTRFPLAFISNLSTSNMDTYLCM